MTLGGAQSGAGSRPAGLMARLQAQLHPLRQRLQRDPYCRLQSYQEVKLAAALGFSIDVNRAALDDWLRLPGLSIHQARTLVGLSQAGVQFHCLEDIAAALGLPPASLLPLGPVLSFCYYEVAPERRLKVNQATVEQLCQVPKIDPDTARAIVHERTCGGDFGGAAAFQQRLSVPPDWMEHLVHYLSF